MADGAGKLQEEALRRKERLRALRERQLQNGASNQKLENEGHLTSDRKMAWKEGSGRSNNFEEKWKSKKENRNQDEGEPENKQLKEDEDTDEEVKHRELKLRNYVPEDKELKQRQVPNAKPASVEDKVKDQLEAGKPEPIIEEVDLVNLAPRKPDWDLKRDVAKKLEKLEKRTQRAIAELIREKLKGNEDDLASAVGALKQEDYDSE
ncbi:coiled-coil domain-containing protein 12 isoform X1 [Stegostoma tigrinum]|uniref:coiled-coil domain-containing protein 12 isoform X1 n=1 Tax=Stegostoma tigrinum TaxID=3053191 RepID=UPI00202BA25D|nr:coiled-coil domain-containing protein 12 isoform X1 [Stegostoma tigrinum]